MRIALVGTGFVADYYMITLPNHPDLTLVGAFDRDRARLEQFCRFWDVRPFSDLDAVLADPDVEIVVNLTTPDAHYMTTKRMLLAGKHVYCEKPLAMRFEDAAELVDLAHTRGLVLATAPANALSDAHSQVRTLLRRGSIGVPRLAYAEMEDGAVFRDKWREWYSPSGAPWRGLHEFEMGCTLEHAGYALSWLTSLFGAAESLTSFAAVTFPDKGPGAEEITMAPDFSVGCLRFRSGVVARLTSGLAAPKDRSLTILGDGGSITVRDLWDDHSVVHLETLDVRRTVATVLAGRIEQRLHRFLPAKPTAGRRIRHGRSRRKQLPGFPSRIDFAAGIAAQAAAIRSGTSPTFSGDMALHITELALALQGGRDLAQPHRLRSSF